MRDPAFFQRRFPEAVIVEDRPDRLTVVWPDGARAVIAVGECPPQRPDSRPAPGPAPSAN